MKRIYNFGWIIGGLLLLAGCEISNRDNNLSEPLVYFIHDGEMALNLYNTGEDTKYTMPIFKSGLIEKEANIELVVDKKLIEQYNKTHNTTAELLPAEFYQIVNSKQSMGASQQKGEFQIVFKTSLLNEVPDREKYILPLSLDSNGEVQVNQNKKNVIITPIVKPATIGFTNAGTLQEVIPTSASGKIEIPLSIEVPFTNKWNIDFTASIDQTLLDEWNAENGLSYTLPVDGSYELVGEQKLVAGKKVQTIKLVIDKDKLSFGWFAVPIRLSDPSKFEINEAQSTCVVTILNRMERIPHTEWAVVSYDGYFNNEKPELMVDDDENTRWHIRWNSSGAGTTTLPQTLVFKLQNIYSISEFEILRRNDQYNTDLKAGYFEISMDGTNWTRAATFDFGGEKTTSYTSFYCPVAITGKYIKIVITESNRGTQVSVQELKAHGLIIE